MFVLGPTAWRVGLVCLLFPAPGVAAGGVWLPLWGHHMSYFQVVWWPLSGPLVCAALSLLPPWHARPGGVSVVVHLARRGMHGAFVLVLGVKP